MRRFNNVTHNSTAMTVDYGTGILWEDVYKALMSVLDTIRTSRNGAAYDYLMANIYTDCTYVSFLLSSAFNDPALLSRGTDHVSIPTSDAALRLLDIDNMPTGNDEEVQDGTATASASNAAGNAA